MAISSVSGALVVAVETAWTAIQKQHSDVPDVVVTLGAGTGTGPGLTFGHFAPLRWVHGEAEVHELFIGGEGLQRGARAVMGTLLHEAAHGAAQTRGVQDTSRQGRYHNKKFKDIAESFGLTIEQAHGIGWSVTTVPDRTATRYAAAIAKLEKAITAYRHKEGFGAAGGRTNNNNGVAAICDCERKIRVSKSVYEAGPIICGICQSEFVDNSDEK